MLLPNNFYQMYINYTKYLFLLIIIISYGCGSYHDEINSSEGPKISLESDSLYQELSSNSDLEFLIRLDSLSGSNLRAFFSDSTISMETQKLVLKRLANLKRPELQDIIPTLLDEQPFRTDVIRVIADYNQMDFGVILLNRFYEFNQIEKDEIIRTLASRPEYGNLIVQSLIDNRLTDYDIPVDVARQLLRVIGGRFIDVWGTIELADEKIAIDKYSRLLSDKNLSSSNINKGRVLFNKNCGACHKLNGTGGHIGPNLNDLKRKNLDFLIRSIIHPSESFDKKYELVVITMRDNRVYFGTLIRENEMNIEINTVRLQNVILDRYDIQYIEHTEVSVMPPRLFDKIPDADVLDLMAYLSKTLN